MPFSFKQFHIDDSHCGMPVSTDAVLLGAWAKINQAKRILDIGCGSGILAIMAAQRSQGKITAVEIDLAAVNQAKENCKASPWAERLTVIHSDINCFSLDLSGDELFDGIICNPPYFCHGPQSDLKSRADARHTNSLRFEDLLKRVAALLHKSGTASFILPVAGIEQVLELLPNHQLRLSRIQYVENVRGKTPKVGLIEIAKSEAQVCQLQPLVVREPSGQYSNEMIQLTQDFYLKL